MDLSENPDVDPDSDASVYCELLLCVEHVYTHTCDGGNSYPITPGNCVLVSISLMPPFI